MPYYNRKRYMDKKLLTKKQLQTIGIQNQNDIPYRYWSPQTHQYFHQYNGDDEDQNNLENQTYQQFKKMSLKGPNTKGTGRYRFQDIDLIEFVFIQRKNTNEVLNNKKNKKNENTFINNQNLSKKAQLNNKKINKNRNKNKNKKAEDIQGYNFLLSSSIQLLLSGFFKIPSKHNTSINLVINSQTNKIIDTAQLIQYDIKCSKKGKFDVWSLMDFGLQLKEINQKQIQFKSSHPKQKSKITQIKHSKRKILLFLIEGQLLQDGHQVDGRAIGDGVAFVSFKKEDLFIVDLDKNSKIKKDQNTSIKLTQHKQFCYTLPILIHQCLHTLGFDHCTAWSCLMNPVTNQQTILCPACIRKLQSQIVGRSNISQWYKNMVQTLQEIKQRMDNICGSYKILRLWRDLLNLDEGKKNQQLAFTKKIHKSLKMQQKLYKIHRSIKNTERKQQNWK